MRNCSKVKARDIIPNWPRGRSTTVSYYNDIECRLPWLAFRIGLNWAAKTKIHDDLIKELAYHQQQQKMVEAFRRGDLRFIDSFVKPGEVGPVIYFDNVGLELSGRIK